MALRGRVPVPFGPSGARRGADKAAASSPPLAHFQDRQRRGMLALLIFRIASGSAAGDGPGCVT